MSSATSKPPRRSLNKLTNKRNFWPWWQIKLGPREAVLAGRDRVFLSRHIINLRPSRTKPDSILSPAEPAIGLKSTTGINFVKAIHPAAYSVTFLLDRLLAPYLKAKDLTLTLLVEILALVIDVLWLGCFIIFLRLYQETRILNYSIWLDIKTFVRVVYSVLSWPFTWFKFEPVKIRSWSAATKPRDLIRQTALFFTLAMVVTLPLKVVATWQLLTVQSQEVVNLASTGFQGLEQAGTLISQGNADLAQEQLTAAETSFNQALAQVNQLGSDLAGLLAKLPVASEKIALARNLLSASQEVTRAATIVASTLAELEANTAQRESFNLSLNLTLLSQAAAKINSHISQAVDYLLKVEESALPADLSLILPIIKQNLAQVQTNLSSILSLPQLFQQLLVSSQPQTYVVLFQNTSELRPTGGFAGSLALIEFDQGEVRSVQIPAGGPYDWQGSLQRIIRPPEPLRLVRGTWQLQDANWFFDFPASAKKVLWFLRQAGGPDAQGLVALNSEVVVALLKLTGPIELPEYGKVLTADNFMRETQAAVEIEYDRQTNRPKQFIADLAPILFARLLTLEGTAKLDLTRLINQSLKQKSIQLYANDAAIEAQFIKYGWAGEVKAVTSDYLAIVRTNIGGGKTDSVMREKIRHQVALSATGELISRLSLTRTHLGDPRDTFASRRNVTYLRFYVPQGSALLTSQGFTPPPTSYYREVPPEAEYDQDLLALEIERGWETTSGTRVTDEFGKTVFSNWLSLDPGESKTVELVYRLPFKLTPGATWQDLRRYAILFQRQAGVQSLDFTSEFIWPEKLRLRWQEGSSLPVVEANKLEMRSDWSQDEYYGLILEKL